MTLFQLVGFPKRTLKHSRWFCISQRCEPPLQPQKVFGLSKPRAEARFLRAVLSTLFLRAGWFEALFLATPMFCSTHFARGQEKRTG